MARWHSCNVLQAGADPRLVWQFDAHNNSFALHRELTLAGGEPLPHGAVGKGWSSLYQPRLNVAWLPPEHVFIRVAQFPRSSPEETRAMVELQLEKLSPIPITQALWTFHALTPAPGTPPAGAGEGKAADLQTVVVTIAMRSAVEEFLGRLESQGYLADRLELPLLDQLQATSITGDGAWIYPEGGGGGSVFVAWWYGGTLHNLDLLTLPPGVNRATALKDQLMQMAWAGELEGWLTSPPRWHLVADTALGAEWEPPLREGLEQKIEVTAPLAPAELAARTARRAAQADPKLGLLPPEFAKRYQQQLYDRLWGRGLLAALVLYGVGLMIYFIAVQVLRIQTNRVEGRIANIGLDYTNTLRLRDRYLVLKNRQELKFAALDCWEATAEMMPEGLTLSSLNFNGDSKKLSLNGTAPVQQVIAVSDFNDKLRKYVVRSQPLFATGGGDSLRTQVRPGGTEVAWSFALNLKHAEGP